MEEQIVETWQIHSRIALYLLDGIAPASLTQAFAGKGRTVADHLAHLHNVRLMWLKSAAPERLEGLAKIEKEQAGDATPLRSALEASAQAIAELVRHSLANGGRIKGFKPHAVAFVGYLIAHESFHIGKIDAILRQAGHPLDDRVHFGLWEWGVR